MKKLLLLSVMAIMLTGCAASKITTDIGTRIGETYQEAAEKGIVSAEQSIRAWPYISGQLKGLLAANYDLEVMPVTHKIINKLDGLAKKETLTQEETGFVIGSFVRLETMALKQGLDKYGVSIFHMVLRR